MTDIDRLNRTFGISGQLVFFAGPGGMPFVRICNRHASADIALQGAHLTAWQPTDEAPVVWLSPKATFAPGKSIRGGIPICWPWFGAHPVHPHLPAHGFARTLAWRVVECAALPDGSTRIMFELPRTDTVRTLWPHSCRVTYTVTIGRTLTLELATTNTGSHPFILSEALHAYFAIGDIDAVRIMGLEGCDYLDKVDGFRRKTQKGEVTIAGETDRIYLGTPADHIIEDQKLQRRIHITKRQSRSTIVWNPWADKSAQMGDMEPEGYRRMVCVESGNAVEDAVTVMPGATHRLGVAYRIGVFSKAVGTS